MRGSKLALGFALLINAIGLAPAAANAEPQATVPQIAAGYYHSLSLISDGTVWNWGTNDKGQLGNGATSNKAYPVAAKKMDNVRSIAPSVRGGFAIKNDGTLWAWGQNNNGQLGDGTTTDRTSPVPITAIDGITAISGGIGYHTLALKADGTVWAWGKNGNGELGNGTATTQETAPIQTGGLSDAIAVSAGGYHSLALKSDGTVWAWGYGTDGELGNGTAPIEQSVPVQVSGLTGVTAISAGNYHNLALKSDGSVWAWGGNSEGQLGDGTTTNRTKPVQVAGLPPIVAVSAGGWHSLALDADGNVWSWGSGGQGQLGDGTAVTRKPLPTIVPGLDGVAQIAAGAFHSLAMTEDGKVWAWGYNGGGQLGNGGYESKPSPHPSSAKMDYAGPDTAGGAIAVSAVTSTGAVLSWTKATDNLTPGGKLQYLAYISPQNNISTVASIANGTPVGTLAPDLDSAAVTGLQPGTTYYANVLVQDQAGNKSVYAMQPVTTSQVYKVLYDGNGASGGQVPVDQAVYEPGQSAVALGNTGGLWKTDFSFNGWNTAADGTGDAYAEGAAIPIVVSNVILYADWKADSAPSTEPPVDPAAKHAVIYHGNGHTGGDVPVDSNHYERDATVTVLGNANGLARAGYAFAGWNTKADGTGTSYLPGETFVMGAEDARLYADWTEQPPAESSGPLTGLALSAGTLAPSFDPRTTNYTARVSYGTDAIRLTPIAADPAASISASVYGGQGELATGPLPLASGSASSPLPLLVGTNRIEIAVGSSDGSTVAYTIEATREAPPVDPPVLPPPVPPTVSPPESSHGYPILLNDQWLSNAAQSEKKEKDGRTTLTIRMMADGLPAMEPQSRVVIPVTDAGDEVTVQWFGDTLRSLEANRADIEIRTPNGNYALPASAIGIDRLRERVGDQASLADLVVSIGIRAGGDEEANRLTAAASQGGFAALTPPVGFSIAASCGDETLPVGRFGSYLRSEIPLPSGTDAARATTVVRLNEGGSVRQAPTSIETRDGQAYAVFYSLTDGMFAPISYASSFADMNGHWARDAVNDLASRMILTGTDDSRFHPGAAATRAEFAAMLARALGLPAAESIGFRDAEAGAWYSEIAAEAAEWGIVQGYADGTFRPSAPVTREEAVAMIGRAMAVAGLNADAGDRDASAGLAAYADGDLVGPWSRAAWAVALREGLVTGYAGELRPQAPVTRAETAALVERLLTRAGFIGASQP